MAFWNWLNANYELTGERFGYTKRITVGVIVFLLIPMLIYSLVTWDPTIGLDEDGEPVRLGIHVVVGLYWLGAYFAYKSYERKTKLNHLLDKLLDEEGSEHLFHAAKSRRQSIRNDEHISLKEGESRGVWFGL